MIGTKSTHLTSRLQRCDPKMAKNTTSHASFGEIPLLQKSEKQKLLHFQNTKLEKIETTSYEFNAEFTNM